MCKRDAETVKVRSKTQEATSNHRNAYHTWCKVNQRKRRRRKKTEEDDGGAFAKRAEKSIKMNG